MSDGDIRGAERRTAMTPTVEGRAALLADRVRQGQPLSLGPKECVDCTPEDPEDDPLPFHPACQGTGVVPINPDEALKWAAYCGSDEARLLVGPTECGEGCDDVCGCSPCSPYVSEHPISAHGGQCFDCAPWSPGGDFARWLSGLPPFLQRVAAVGAGRAALPVWERSAYCSLRRFGPCECVDCAPRRALAAAWNYCLDLTQANREAWDTCMRSLDQTEFTWVIVREPFDTARNVTYMNARRAKLEEFVRLFGTSPTRVEDDYALWEAAADEEGGT